MRLTLYFISFFIILSTLCFGVINEVVTGFKPGFKLLITLFLISSLTLFIFQKRKSILINSLFVLLFLIFSPGVINILIGYFKTPTIPAMDCEGHLPMNLNFVKGFIIGFFLTIILSISIYKSSYYSSKLLKILAIICLVVTVLSYLKFAPFVNLNKKMNNIVKPIVIYPEDC